MGRGRGRDTNLSRWGEEEEGTWALVFWGRAPGVVGAVAEKGPPVGEVSAESLSVGAGREGGAFWVHLTLSVGQAGVTWRLALALAHCGRPGPTGLLKAGGVSALDLSAGRDSDVQGASLQFFLLPCLLFVGNPL